MNNKQLILMTSKVRAAQRNSIEAIHLYSIILPFLGDIVITALIEGGT